MPAAIIGNAALTITMEMSFLFETSRKQVKRRGEGATCARYFSFSPPFLPSKQKQKSNGGDIYEDIYHLMMTITRHMVSSSTEVGIIYFVEQQILFIFYFFLKTIINGQYVYSVQYADMTCKMFVGYLTVKSTSDS